MADWTRTIYEGTTIDPAKLISETTIPNFDSVPKLSDTLAAADFTRRIRYRLPFAENFPAGTYSATLSAAGRWGAAGSGFVIVDNLSAEPTSPLTTLSNDKFEVGQPSAFVIEWTLAGGIQPGISFETTLLAESIDLREIVKVLPNPAGESIERTYVLDSTTPLQPYNIRLVNCATNMEAIVVLSGPSSVVFFREGNDTPISGLTMQAQDIVDLQVKFDNTELDKLPEGINASEIIIGLSAGKVTLAEGETEIGISCPDVDQPPQPDPEPEPEPEPEPIESWIECSTGNEYPGTPPDGWVQTDAGCWEPPPEQTTKYIITINATELDPVIDSTGQYGRSQLQALIAEVATITQYIDPTLYSYSWNLDVEGQGAGTGATDSDTIIASWKMTSNDLTRLQEQGWTSRRVSVTATRSGETRTQFKDVVLRDSRLLGTIGEPPPPTDGGSGGTTGGTDGGTTDGQDTIIKTQVELAE